MTRDGGGWLRTALGKLVLLICCVLVLSSAGFWWLEFRPDGREGLFEALWWTVVTMTTVGYGDYVPQTVPGRILGIMVMFCGIGLVSTLTGNLASLLVERQARKRQGLLNVKLSGHYLILGWNPYGAALVESMKASGLLRDAGLALVNDLSQEDREELAYRLDLGEKLHFVHGNPAQESVVHRAAPAQARVIFLLAHQGLTPKDADQQSIYAALTVRALAPKVPIYAQVLLVENREHLLRAGVTETIVGGELVSRLLGLMGANPGYWPFFKCLLGFSDDGCMSFRPLTPQEQALTWGEFSAAFRASTGGLPLAVCHTARQLSLGDIMDESSALDQFILELFSASGQKTEVGSLGAQVVVNPSDGLPLGGFETVIFLAGGRGAAQPGKG